MESEIREAAKNTYIGRKMDSSKFDLWVKGAVFANQVISEKDYLNGDQEGNFTKLQKREFFRAVGGILKKFHKIP